MTTRPSGNAPKPAPEGTLHRPSRRNVLSFGLITAGAVGGAGFFLWPVLRQSTLSTPEATVPVVISMSGFSPNVLTARVGEKVRLQLVNKDNSLHSDGGGWHQFAIDDLALDYKVAPLSESEVSFTVDKPGNYDFYCGICCGGKANPYMHGELVVE
ncbi:MAG: cupredoxin domain-containing protein, partial [Halocynthiibacter sp.]